MAKVKRKDNGTIFDDVYRTITQKMPQWVVPLINLVFHTDYPEDIEQKQLRNEHLEKHRKIITDSMLEIAGHIYHIECQSTQDGQMVLRMFAYDSAAAIEDARKDEDGILHIRFPSSAVLYLRSNSRTPKELRAMVDFPDGESKLYQVPLIRLADFSLDEIFEKRMLIFLPYYLMRYEKLFAQIEADAKRREKLLEEMQGLAERLQEFLVQEGKLGQYVDMSELIVRVADHILREYHRTKKGVDHIMGGKVLELYSERMMRLGRRAGKKEGIKEGKKEGLKEGAFAALKSLVAQGIITASVAAKQLDISEEAFLKKEML